jgi:hypothetical protein
MFLSYVTTWTINLMYLKYIYFIYEIMMSNYDVWLVLDCDTWHNQNVPHAILI